MSLTRYLALPLLAAALALGVPAGAQDHDHGGGHSHEAPTAKLKQIFPKAESFVTKDLTISPDARQRIEAKLGKKLHDHDLQGHVFVATTGGRSTGVAREAHVHMDGEVDIVVGVDLKGAVQGVVVTGAPAAVCSPSFLNQFKGKTAASAMKVGGDVKAAPGAAQASTTIAFEVRESVLILTEAALKR